MSEAHHLACSYSSKVHALMNLDSEITEFYQIFLFISNNIYKNDGQYYFQSKAYTTFHVFMIGCAVQDFSI